MNWEHCMLDLETLSTRPGGIILSIGAVFFDPMAQDPGPAFYQVIDVASSCVAGLRGDSHTIKWWEKQSPEAREAYDEAFSGAGEPLQKTLEAFQTFLVSQSGRDDGADSVKVWGNGAAFDNAILAYAYQAAGLGVPWKFFNDRCFRTLKALGKEFGVTEPKRTGVHHHALDDALHQANWACMVLRAMAPHPVPEGDRGPAEVSHLTLSAAGRQGGKTQKAYGTGGDAYIHQAQPGDPEPSFVQEMLPDPPVRNRSREWPMCTAHPGTAMMPTSTGFVCPVCHGRS